MTKDVFDDDTFDFPEFDDFKSDVGMGKVPGKTSKDRNPAKGIGRIMSTGLKASVKGAGSALGKSLERAMPNTAGLFREGQQILSGIERERLQLAKEIQPTMLEGKKLFQKALPLAKNYMPGGTYQTLKRRIDESLAVEDRGSTSEAGETSEALRSKSIEDAFTSVMHETESIQEERRTQDKKEASIERAIDRQLDASRHTEVIKVLREIYNPVRVMGTFYQKIYPGYIKKSLELQYKQLFTQQDILATLQKSVQINETYLDAIRHNTSIPETQKRTKAENIKEAMQQRFGNMMTDWGKNILLNVKERVFDPLRGANEQVKGIFEMGGAGLDLYDSMQGMEDMGIAPPSLMDVIAGGVGSHLGGTAAGKFAGKKLGKYAPHIKMIEQRARNAKMEAALKARDLQGKHDGTKGFLASLIDPRLRNDAGRFGNQVSKDPNADAVYDNATAMAIKEVIPGWLGKIHQELASIRTGKVQEEQVFDVKTRNFTSVSNLRRNTFASMFGTQQERTERAARGTAVLRGSASHHGKSTKNFAKLNDDVTRVIANMTTTLQQIKGHEFEFKEVAETGQLDTDYKRKVFQSIPKDRITMVAELFCSSIFDPSGRIDEQAVQSFQNYLLREFQENDRYIEEFSKLADAFGQARYFNDLIDGRSSDGTMRFSQKRIGELQYGNVDRQHYQKTVTAGTHDVKSMLDSNARAMASTGLHPKAQKAFDKLMGSGMDVSLLNSRDPAAFNLARAKLLGSNVDLTTTGGIAGPVRGMPQAKQQAGSSFKFDGAIPVVIQGQPVAVTFDTDAFSTQSKGGDGSAVVTSVQQFEQTFKEYAAQQQSKMTDISENLLNLNIVREAPGVVGKVFRGGKSLTKSALGLVGKTASTYTTAALGAAKLSKDMLFGMGRGALNTARYVGMPLLGMAGSAIGWGINKQFEFGGKMLRGAGSALSRFGGRVRGISEDLLKMPREELVANGYMSEDGEWTDKAKELSQRGRGVLGSIGRGIGSAARTAGSLATSGMRGAGGLYKDALGMTMRGAGQVGKFGLDLGRKLFGLDPKDGKMVGTKTLKKVVGDKLDRIVEILERVYPEKGVLGDIDGDGLRENSWQDKDKKRAERLGLGMGIGGGGKGGAAAAARSGLAGGLPGLLSSTTGGMGISDFLQMYLFNKIAGSKAGKFVGKIGKGILSAPGKLLKGGGKLLLGMGKTIGKGLLGILAKGLPALLAGAGSLLGGGLGGLGKGAGALLRGGKGLLGKGIGAIAGLGGKLFSGIGKAGLGLAGVATGTSLLGGAKAGATAAKVGGDVAKVAGVASKGGSLASKIAGIVAKLVSKLPAKFAKVIKPQAIIKAITKGGSKIMGKIVSKFLGPIGWILTIGSAGYAAVQGYRKADEILQIPEDKLTTMDKLKTGAAAAVTDALLLEDLGVLSTAGLADIFGAGSGARAKMEEEQKKDAEGKGVGATPDQVARSDKQLDEDREAVEKERQAQEESRKDYAKEQSKMVQMATDMAKYTIPGAALKWALSPILSSTAGRYVMNIFTTEEWNVQFQEARAKAYGIDLTKSYSIFRSTKTYMLQLEERVAEALEKGRTLTDSDVKDFAYKFNLDSNDKEISFFATWLYQRFVPMFQIFHNLLKSQGLSYKEHDYKLNPKIASDLVKEFEKATGAKATQLAPLSPTNEAFKRFQAALEPKETLANATNNRNIQESDKREHHDLMKSTDAVAERGKYTPSAAAVSTTNTLSGIDAARREASQNTTSQDVKTYSASSPITAAPAGTGSHTVDWGERRFGDRVTPGTQPLSAGTPAMPATSGAGGEYQKVPMPQGDGSFQAHAATIVTAAKMAGVDPGLMATMAGIESSFRSSVRAGTSSATGLYQFVSGTWRDMVNKYGKKYGIDASVQPTDPRANALMGAEYLKENMQYLKSKLGRQPTDTDLYLAHFLGAGGATQLLKGSPSDLGTKLNPKAAKANPSIFYDATGRARTLQEIYSLLDNKVNAFRSKYASAARSMSGMPNTTLPASGSEPAAGDNKVHGTTGVEASSTLPPAAAGAADAVAGIGAAPVDSTGSSSSSAPSVASMPPAASSSGGVSGMTSPSTSTSGSSSTGTDGEEQQQDGSGGKGVVRPTDSPVVTSPFGPRNLPGNKGGASKNHKGIDLRARQGEVIKAIKDGVVTGNVGGSYGITAIDHGGGLVSRYMHQAKIAVKAGQKVSAGDVIGYSGGRGPQGPNQYNPHLHFEVIKGGRPVDPESFLKGSGIQLQRKGDPSNPQQVPQSEVGLEDKNAGQQQGSAGATTGGGETTPSVSGGGSFGSQYAAENGPSPTAPTVSGSTGSPLSHSDSLTSGGATGASDVMTAAAGVSARGGSDSTTWLPQITSLFDKLIQTVEQVGTGITKAVTESGTGTQAAMAAAGSASGGKSGASTTSNKAGASHFAKPVAGPIAPVDKKTTMRA